MLELGSSGSVRGVSSNGHPYRDPRATPAGRDRHATGRVAPLTDIKPDGLWSKSDLQYAALPKSQRGISRPIRKMTEGLKPDSPESIQHLFQRSIWCSVGDEPLPRHHIRESAGEFFLKRLKMAESSLEAFVSLHRVND